MEAYHWKTRRLENVVLEGMDGFLDEPFAHDLKQVREVVAVADHADADHVEYYVFVT